MKLTVFTTSRAIREYINTNDILQNEKLITLGDFESRALIVPSLKFIDTRLRVFYLKRACEFDRFEDLKIDIDFFSFVKNYEIIFKFFSELLNENLTINDIELRDTYAEYDSHLNILKQVLHNYEELLASDGYTDTIFTPSNYILNEVYLKEFDNIEVKLNGYLSGFEYKILKEIACLTTLRIIYTPNKFNKKMSLKFEEYFGEELIYNITYNLDFSNKKIEQTNKQTKNYIYDEYQAKTRLEQVAFVKKKIYDYIQSEIEPEKIVVITPDEKFTKILSDFDNENNLNFAMGFSYENAPVYQKLNTIYKYMNEKSNENRHRLDRYEISAEFVDELNQVSTFEEFEDKLVQIVNEDDNIDIYKEELHYLKLVTQKQDLDIKSIFFLLLATLAKKTISDSRGGKITVMGVLESRGVCYDGIIVVDFNDDKVPKKNKKDLFLSSEVRAKVGLPTMQDRQNLQKSYYEALFSEAKYVSISYVKDDVSDKSRFLDEIKPHFKVLPNDYKTILFNKTKSKNHYLLEDLELEYEFETLSASRLKVFLECKRKYYFRYIKKIKPNPVYQDRTALDIGISLHEILKRVYQKQSFFESIAELKSSFDYELDTYSVQNKLDDIFKFKLDIVQYKINRFFKDEIVRFDMGHSTKYVEKSFKSSFEGLNIVGQIDRVDLYEDKFVVYDYKTGSIKLDKKIKDDVSDFQLVFYFLLLKDIKPVDSLYYVNIIKGEYQKEELLEEKLEVLKEIFKKLKEPKQNFRMCEKLSICRFCEYSTICGRQND